MQSAEVAIKSCIRALKCISAWINIDSHTSTHTKEKLTETVIWYATKS